MSYRNDYEPCPTTGCWLWSGPLTSDGYGRICKGPHRDERAHRRFYADRYGTIRPGLVLDHLCRNKACVNPDHLEATTDRVNVLRGDGITAMNAKALACKHGHKFSEENTIIETRPDGRTRRRCRKCRSIIDRKRRSHAA